MGECGQHSPCPRYPPHFGSKCTGIGDFRCRVLQVPWLQWRLLWLKSALTMIWWWFMYFVEDRKIAWGGWMYKREDEDVKVRNDAKNTLLSLTFYVWRKAQRYSSVWILSTYLMFYPLGVPTIFSRLLFEIIEYIETWQHRSTIRSGYCRIWKNHIDTVTSIAVCCIFNSSRESEQDSLSG